MIRYSAVAENRMMFDPEKGPVASGIQTQHQEGLGQCLPGCKGRLHNSVTTLSRPPGLQLHARGWAFVILCCTVIVSNQFKKGGRQSNDKPMWLVIAVVGADRGRCRRRAYMACSSLTLKKKDKKNPSCLAIASEGVSGFTSEVRNPPRLAVACKGVGFCHPVLRCHCQ